jgi:hypothetical protein
MEQRGKTGAQIGTFAPRFPDGCHGLGNAPGRLAPRLEIWFLTIEQMTIQRMEHVCIVVGDLAAANEFFVELGLVLQGEGPYNGLMSEIVGSVWVCAPSAPRNTTSS